MHIEDLLTTIALNIMANAIYDCIKILIEIKSRAKH